MSSQASNQPYQSAKPEVKSSCFLVTGPAGAGVTTTLEMFSHFGFMQIGDVKAEQWADMYQLLKDKSPRMVFSLLVEEDQKDALAKVSEQFLALKADNPDLNLLVMDAADSVIVNRFLESGKPHPYDTLGLEAGVKQDKTTFDVFKSLKSKLSNGYYAIDSGTVSLEELKLKIAKILGVDTHVCPMTIQIQSFGYKHGVPSDAEMVFDMRFIQNPYYDDKLRPLTGLDPEVKDFIFHQPPTKAFIEQLFKMFQTLVPHYHQEGKLRLSVGIGCTGGQHRSVCVSETLADFLRRTFPSYNVVITHREKAHWPAAVPNQTKVLV